MRPDYARLNELPAPASSRLIDFERVEIVTLESFPPQLVLVVSGTKPYFNMEVTLAPLMYVRQPEYWGIEVVGTLPGAIGLPALAPYQVSLPLAGIVGTKGIEVIGASRSERRELDAEPASQPSRAGVFELRGDDAQLAYTPADDPEDRHLRFRGADHDRDFGGAELRLSTSEFGELVTVGLQEIPDEPLVKLTLLVPPVNLGQATEAAVETIAIISTDRQAALTAEPPEGQLVTYKTFALSGTARRGASSPRGTLLFSRDDRPVDGQLRELKIAAEDASSFTASLRTAYIDRVNQVEVDETEKLAAGLSCTITNAEVRCSRDERPVDGQLKELVVSRTDGGTFDATLRTAFFDRINGTEVDETIDIATGLTRQ